MLDKYDAVISVVDGNEKKEPKAAPEVAAAAAAAAAATAAATAVVADDVVVGDTDVDKQLDAKKEDEVVPSSLEESFEVIDSDIERDSVDEKSKDDIRIGVLAEESAVEVEDVSKEERIDVLGTDDTDITTVVITENTSKSKDLTHNPNLEDLDSLLGSSTAAPPTPLISTDTNGDDEYADDLYEFDDIQSPSISSLSSLPASQSSPSGGAPSISSTVDTSPIGTAVRETSDGSSGSSQQQLPNWDQYHIATAEKLLNPTRLYSISHALSSPILPNVVQNVGFITPEDVRAFIATSEVCIYLFFCYDF